MEPAHYKSGLCHLWLTDKTARNLALNARLMAKVTDIMCLLGCFLWTRGCKSYYANQGLGVYGITFVM